MGFTLEGLNRMFYGCQGQNKYINKAIICKNITKICSSPEAFQPKCPTVLMADLTGKLFPKEQKSNIANI